MKEKNKNILKGIGIGALACFGMFTFSGCSVELSQSQIDKLMYAVDNSQQFMDDALHLLENQNAKMDAEQAHKLCEYAYNKILLNQNGIRNNLVMKNYRDGELATTVTSYADENTDIIILDTISFNEVWYSDNGNNYHYVKQSERKTELKEDSIHAAFSWASCINVVNALGVNAEDILFCDILSNGNYQITYSVNNMNDADLEVGDIAKILVVEITSEGDFVKVEMDSAEYSEQDDELKFRVKTTVTFEYGKVDVNAVNARLTEAKNCEVK